MWPDRVSNSGPLALKADALRGPAHLSTLLKLFKGASK